MKYDPSKRELLRDDGTVLKRINCPLEKRWDQLQVIDRGSVFDEEVYELKRYCDACTKSVINISGFDENQVAALLQVEPDTCLYAASNSKNVKFLVAQDVDIDPSTIGFRDNTRPGLDSDDADAEEVDHDGGLSKKGGWTTIRQKYSCYRNDTGAVVVQTGRTLNAINRAARNGYWPLLKAVGSAPRREADSISSILERRSRGSNQRKLLVAQNNSGEVHVSDDYRSTYRDEGFSDPEHYWYDPYQSPLPFAAYLIPSGLEPGTKVFLPDLIETITASSWNQGDTYRCITAYAIWNGEDLEIEEQEVMEMIG